MAPVGEVEFANGVARASAAGAYGPTQVAAGIVGYAALEQGAVMAPVVEALLAAGEGRLVGLRGHASWSPLGVRLGVRGGVQGRLQDAAFREGFALMGRHGLAYDSAAFHPQMADLADLADVFPETPIILNHVGLPLLLGPYADRRDEVMGAWRAGIEALGRRSNVFFKLGGLGISTFGFGYDQRPKPLTSQELERDMRPFFEPCIAAAGAERCMFEADFPPDKISYSYGTYWNACKRLTQGYSGDERRALFAGTAKRAYGLAVEI
jgi:L-fuconolactonase